jgi:predicted amidohydrolase
MTRAIPRIAFAAVLAAAAGFAAGPERNTSSAPPRKAIVGTVVQAYWVEYPGLGKRLAQLGAVVDRMAAESKQTYGRGLDLAVLPEVAVTGEMRGDIVAGSVPLAGRVQEFFSRKAAEHRCYIVVPLFMLEDKARRICSNAAVLIDRKGDVAGIYRKMHLAVQNGSDSFEGGMTPGKEVPVFACDFGRLGIQICFDIEFDYGWRELARKGAELIAWPTQSPQTTHPAARAREGNYYIVSSNWRNNSSIFEPTGKIISQVKQDSQVLVQELDLSYAILPWSPQLKNGKGLENKYGNKVGYRYYPDEDCGFFWSNDPGMSIGAMARSIGVLEAGPELERVRKLFRKAGVPE